MAPKTGDNPLRKHWQSTEKEENIVTVTKCLKLWKQRLFTFSFWLFRQQNIKVLSSIISEDFLLFSLEQFVPLARATKYQGYVRFSRAKIWNALPLDLRSEHHIIKFAFGLKRHFRSKPKLYFLTFVILSCTIFLSVFCCVCCFNFLFHQGPIQTSLAERGTPEWILFNVSAPLWCMLNAKWLNYKTNNDKLAIMGEHCLALG